jgi:hypothetical protein
VETLWIGTKGYFISTGIHRKGHMTIRRGNEHLFKGLLTVNIDRPIIIYSFNI